MGGLLTVPAFLERFPQVNIIDNNSFHNAWVTGLTVGTWNLGCVVSAVLAIFISDSLGRRRTLLLGITLWTVGEIIQVSSYSFAQFVVGRAIAGFGNGFTTSTAPAYQAECVKSHRKGTILMISAGAFVSLGYALSYWSVFGFAYVNNADAAWRVPIAIQISFALPAIAMLAFWMPDSPRWLILTGREQEALSVIAALNDDDPDGYEVKDEFLQIKDAILIMAQGTTSKLFSNKDRRGFHRVVLAFFVQVFQQGTGINLVLQYLSWIFLMRMGYAGWLARLLASCSATTYFLASFVTVVGIDRFWGRRSLMMFGASGMSGCMILLTITQYLWTIKSINGARIASTVFLFGFSVFFAIGWQGMAWLYQVEIVPLRIRGPANALSTLGNWLVNFTYVHRYPFHQCILANLTVGSCSLPRSPLPTLATAPGSYSRSRTSPSSPSYTSSTPRPPSAHSRRLTLSSSSRTRLQVTRG
jgi:MFS family permease